MSSHRRTAETEVRILKTRATTAIVVGALLALSLPTAVAAQDETPAASPGAADGTSVIFVASAPSGSISGTTLTLDAPASVVFVTDRPERKVGHLQPADLVDLWAEGDDSFTVDPPNAIVSFLEIPDEDGSSAILVLTSSSVADGSLSFEFEVLEGTVTDGDVGVTSLFSESRRCSSTATAQTPSIAASA